MKDTWTRKFMWTLGKAESWKGEMKLKWEGTDPWRLWIGEEEIIDFPYIHAEDWVLAERYAEKYEKKN